MSSTTEPTSAPTLATKQSSVPLSSAAASSSSGVIFLWATKIWYALTPSSELQVRAIPLELCRWATRTTLSGMGILRKTNDTAESTPGASDPGLNVFQLAREVRRQEAPLAVGQDEHLVLDADAESALRQVDAGLDRDHRAGGKRRAVDSRVVHVESEEVPEAVDELVEEAGLLERSLGDLLQISHGDAFLDRREDVLLRLVDGAVHLGLLVAELPADRIRARHVGGVAPVLGGGIHHHQIAVAQHPRVLAPVQHRAVLAAADDAAVREAGRARGEERVLHLRLHVALADAGQGGPRHRLVARVRDGDGALHQRDLLRRVRLPQPRQE